VTLHTERGVGESSLPTEEVCIAGASIHVGRGADATRLLDERWDALVSQQPIPNPTLVSAWLREMVRLTTGTPIIIVVEKDYELLAGGAFSTINIGGRRGLRIATWLGRNGRPVIGPDLLVSPKAASAGELVFKRLLSVDAHAVWLYPTALDGPAALALRRSGLWHYCLPRLEGWTVTLPPPKLETLRAKVAYRVRRAQRLGVSIEVREHADPPAVAAALERLFDLHHRRWIGRKDYSQFSHSDKARAWHRSAVSALAVRGQVRIVEVLEDRTLVASLLGLLAGSGSIFHTPATQAGGRLRGPGHLAMLTWVDAAIKAGAHSMHLGRGSGEAQGPKGSLGPTRFDSGVLLASRRWLQPKSKRGSW
jgi:hypothetical protein